jgi:hypothetical protein
VAAAEEDLVAKFDDAFPLGTARQALESREQGLKGQTLEALLRAHVWIRRNPEQVRRGGDGGACDVE